MNKNKERNVKKGQEEKNMECSHCQIEVDRDNPIYASDYNSSSYLLFCSMNCGKTYWNTKKEEQEEKSE